MLHIVLTILKIIGITILVILGIILALLLIILFVPIRYDIKASKDEKVHVNATIHWILHIITIRYLIDNGSDFYIKIFGIKLKNKKNEPKEKKGKKEKEPKAKKKKETTTDNDSTKALKHTALQIDNTQSENAQSKITEDVSEKKKVSFIKNIITNIKAKIESFKKTLLGIKNTITKKTSFFFEMINDEANKKAISKLFNSIKKLLKAIIPKKHNIYVKYGKEDPASLADIIGYVAIFKSATDINLKFEPVFDENILEAKSRFKGSLQLIFVLILLIKIYRDKDIRKLINNFTD